MGWTVRGLIPVGARFSTLIQTGPGTYPASWPGPGVDHPTPYSAEVKERVELYLYSTSGPLWPVTG